MKKIRLLKDDFPAGVKAGDICDVAFDSAELIGFENQEGLEHIFQKDVEGSLFEYVKYKFVQDDDAHWYIIDSKEEDHFYQWVNDTQDWDRDEEASEFDFSDNRIGGAPSLITILDYEE